MYQIIQDPATGNFCLFHTKKGKTTATAPATSHLHRRARRAAREYPHLTERLWKAATIAAAGNIHPIDTPLGDVAQVQSETDPLTIYHIHQTTDPDGKPVLCCTCPDYASGRAQSKKQTVCKHVLACFLQSWQDTSDKPPAAAPRAAT